jgi:hypothetical protein
MRLNTAYRVLTGMITDEISHHVELYGIVPEEQLAVRKGQQECL